MTLKIFLFLQIFDFHLLFNFILIQMILVIILTLRLTLTMMLLGSSLTSPLPLNGRIIESERLPLGCSDYQILYNIYKRFFLFSRTFNKKIHQKYSLKISKYSKTHLLIIVESQLYQIILIRMAQFCVVLLKLQEVQQCAQFIAQRFVKQQIFKAFQINAENLASLIKRIASYGIKRALAFKVIHLETMKVAAYFLLTDLYDDKEIYDQRHYDKNTNQYLKVFDLLQDDFLSKQNVFDNLIQGVWIRISEICIKQQFRYQSLGFNIFKFMIAYSKYRNFNHIVWQALNEIVIRYIPKIIQNLEQSPLINRILMNQLQIDGKKIMQNSKAQITFNYINIKNSIKGGFSYSLLCEVSLKSPQQIIK